MNHQDYMRLALELAERGAGWTNPNPLVGAVIVKDGAIIGQGYHQRYGQAHAERNALQSCTQDPRGATLYVTLEPCCHQGKQPPCTQAILDAGIAKVVVGSHDPNPLVAGKGLEILRSHGIEVETGVCQEACDALNQVFFHYIRTRRPYVVMKYAMTMDGKIATRTGASRWITGPEARAQVHRDRNRYAAILVGVGTVLTDDPLLTCRMEGGRNPLRIVCDTHLRTPLDRQLVRTASQVRRDGIALWYTIEASPALLRYVVEKGSITVDGISLTVAWVEAHRFAVSIIPHTASVTVLGEKGVGDVVNLETDLLAKYVEKLLRPQEAPQPESNITWEFLAEHGF